MTPFRPHPLLPGGHLQTIFAACGRAPADAGATRQHLLPTTDGDRLVLHEDSPQPVPRDPVSALLIHGLAGSHRSTYMVRIARKLAAQGARVFRLDQRGCGAGISHARGSSHAGRSEDVAAAIEFIADREPDCRLAAIGFSLGGNQLLKLLGERPGDLPNCLRSALAVAPPIDLQACGDNLARPSRIAYNRWFVRHLNRLMHRRRDVMQPLALARPPRTLLEFDDCVTAPLGGFENARDYYARASAAPQLGRIDLPTAILAARDDPIVPFGIFSATAGTPRVRLHATRHGGHVGFVGRRNSDPDRCWLDWRVVDFVARGHLPCSAADSDSSRPGSTDR